MTEKKRPPLIIPVFIPHSGCPHCCAFCNQSLITGQKNVLPGPDKVAGIIRHYLAYQGNRSRVELAFFGGNFLGLPRQQIHGFLEMVKPHLAEGKINGIRFSTRPDTISRETLDMVAAHGISLIELGVQSMDDRVLEKNRRGHTRSQTRQALDLLKAYAIPAGVQVMVGLPGETENGLIQGVEELASFLPEIARIYPLLVLRGSLVAKWYAEGSYVPLSLEQAVAQAKQVYQLFTRAGVNVIRMGLQASEMMEDTAQVLAGPWHPAFGHLVFSSVFFDKVLFKLQESGLAKTSGNIVLKVHPCSESRLRGDKNNTLNQLRKDFPQVSFSIERDRRLALDALEVF